MALFDYVAQYEDELSFSVRSGNGLGYELIIF